MTETVWLSSKSWTGVNIIGASLSEPHLGPYSGYGLYRGILPNAHARSLRGEFKGQSRQRASHSERY